MLDALSRTGRPASPPGGAAVVVVLGLLLWWVLPLGEPTPSGSLTFSTGVRSGVYQRYGERLRGALAKDMPEVSIRLRTSEGSQQNIERVATGKADFTIATADALATYLRDGKPGAERLRGCVRLYDDYIQLVVPRDSDVQQVSDLMGKQVGVGQPGSGVRLVADRLMTAAGLDPTHDITPVPAGIDTMPKRLENGLLDAFFWSGGLPTTAVQELSDRFAIRLVPLEDPLIKQLQAAWRVDPLLPLGHDACRRLSQRAAGAGRADGGGRQCGGHHGPYGCRDDRGVHPDRDRQPGPHRARGARGAAGGPADGDLHESAAAARRGEALLPLGQALTQER